MTGLPRPGTGVGDMCKQGDQHLEAGQLGRATALYTTAFRTHAGSTMSHMRGLDRARLSGVISTLEDWLDGHGEAQTSMEGLNKGLAAVFLSTLSPNNLSASLFKMESVLKGASQGCEEIFSRCSTLLEGKRNPRPEGSTRVVLELTQALACLLTHPHNPKGLALYLKAYRENKLETVRQVRGRQAQHLPKILMAYSEQISHKHLSLTPEVKTGNGIPKGVGLDPADTSDFLEFLTAVLPGGDSRVLELAAMQFFSTGRFEESAEAFSAILNGPPQLPSKVRSSAAATENTSQGLSPERQASLLTSRAAALFSAGGRATEVCRDLGEAFEVHPATARMVFQRLFVDQGTGAAVRVQLRQQAERGLSGYRENVMARPDLRSTEGLELLDPVIAQLRALCHLESDGGARELRVRLADCLLLRGEHKEALSICSQLACAAPSQQSYQNTVQVLRGYARLLSDDQQGALEDFQAVIEHNAPHPSSCVRALCGRGLLRMMGGLPYLTALDYATASRLQPQDTALTVRCLVPWNRRGLLCTVLLEQGRAMLEGRGDPSAAVPEPQDKQQRMHPASPQRKDSHREGTPVGVHSLAQLLMELQPGLAGPQILAADALYRLGRVEEAHRLLLAVGPSSLRASVLARLALLQMHRGFLYDANQLLKKLIQCGDTSCLRPLLVLAPPEDCALLQDHCHSASKRILDGQRHDSALREAVAYLSIAIMASGGEAAESLLERARCYALLGQRKTAIFDFSAILREHPDHVHALCGRAFTYLTLNQQKECTQDVLAALQINTDTVTKDILSLKNKARKLVCDWLQQYCRTNLMEILAVRAVPCQEEQLREAFLIGGALMKTDCREPRWHLLYVDILLANGEVKAAEAHLTQVFGREPREAAAQARVGVVEAWQENHRLAALGLSTLAERDTSALDFLLALVPPSNKKRMAQAAAQEASSVSAHAHWDKALSLLTVAVRAVGESRPQYLRQRAACLAQLGLHERAVADLDRVIQTHVRTRQEEPQLWAEDLCRRGRSLVLISREGPGLEDFTQALELHQDQALRCVEAGLGRARLAECFLRGALQSYGEQQLHKAWDLLESGLLVDSEHTELRRLRGKVKREVSSPCLVH